MAVETYPIWEEIHVDALVAAKAVTAEIANDEADLVHEPLRVDNYITPEQLRVPEIEYDAKVVEYCKDEMQTTFLLFDGDQIVKHLALHSNTHGSVSNVVRRRNKFISEVRLWVVILVRSTCHQLKLVENRLKLAEKIYPRNRQLVLDVSDGLFGGHDFDGRLKLVGQYTLLGASQYILEFFNVHGSVVNREKEKISILLDGILPNDFWHSEVRAHSRYLCVSSNSRDHPWYR